jgi:hypothetical protein
MGAKLEKRHLAVALPDRAMVTGLSEIWPVAKSTGAYRSLPGRVLRLEAALWRCLLPGPAFFGSPIYYPGSLLHHWHLSYCNWMAVPLDVRFQ